MTLVIAHRGASAEAPENSLAAFRRAVELQADGIELDVHATADAILVTHDPPRDRLFPTLDEALAVIGPETTVFVEAKTLTPKDDAKLLAAIDAAPAPDRCQVHSFDHRVTRRLQQLRATLPCGILSASYPVDPIHQLRDADVRTLWQDDRLLDRALVDAVHDAGAHLIAWTVDDPSRMRTLANWGVDGICTNRPDVARKALA